MRPYKSTTQTRFTREKREGCLTAPGGRARTAHEGHRQHPESVERELLRRLEEAVFVNVDVDVGRRQTWA